MNTDLRDKALFKVSANLFILLICYNPICGAFVPKTQFGAGIPDLDALRILAYLLLFTFAFEVMSTSSRNKNNNWLVITFIYVLIVILSPIWSNHYSFDKIIIQQLFNSVFLPFLIAYIASRIFIHKYILTRYTVHITISSAILSIIAIVQFILKKSIIHNQLRSMATFENPNALAIFLVLMLPVVFYATDTKQIKPSIGNAVQIITVVAIFTTVSRKGLLTMILVYAIYYIVTQQYKKIMISTFIISILFYVALGFYQISSRLEKESITHQVEGKVAMANAGIDMFINAPVLGLGYKGYYNNFGKYFPYSSRDKYDAHNEYITALANYGIIGFIPFIMIFIYPLIWAKKKLRYIRLSPRQPEKLQILVGLLSVVSFALNQFYAGTIFYQEKVVFLLYANISFMFSVSLNSSDNTSRKN